MAQVHVMAYLTPHKISILILIEYFCQHQSPQNDVQKLSQFLLKCIQDPSEYLQNDLKRFGEQVAHEAGQPAWDHLQETLMRIKSLHHLSDFLVSKLQEEDGQSLNTTRPVGLAGLIVSSEPMDPTSILGLYIRKAQIEFRKLLFEDTCQLFCAIETYKASLYKKGNFPDQDGLVVQSVYDAEKYLDLQTQHLSNPSLQDIPNEVLEHVKSVQLRMPTVAKSHYIMCLQAQQTGNFEMAVQSLHQFFDYCMSMHDQALYQYALLNLAILHARFGHFDQARFAIRETVEVARDNMDQECLSYALSWHDRLPGTGATSSAEMNEARNLAGQIEGQSFHYLQSLGELIKARQLQCESTSKTLEALVRSSSINLRHSLDGVGGVVQLFQSRTWEAYGNAPLSSLYSQMQHHFRPSESDMSDAASSLSKFASDLALSGQYQDALRVLEQAKSKFPLRTMRATPWVQTLLQILQKRALGSNRLRDAEIWTAQLGATLVTPIIQTSNLKKRPIEVVEQEREVEIEVATKRGPKGKVTPKKEQELKKEQADEVENIRPTQMDDTTLEIQLDIILQSSLLSVLAGQRLSGIEQLSEGLELVRQNQWPGTQKFTIVYLLALAELYLESDSAISALPLLLVAIMLSEDNFQRPLQFVVKLRMADVLLHLDSVQQASDLVDGVMAMVLNQGDVFVQALAYFQNAKCLLARVSFRSIESLKDIAQVLYFMVRVFHELDLAQDLKAALAEYKKLSKQLLEGTMNQEPSWYSYYYTHDAFDGLLRSETEIQAKMDIDR
ncbi:anaphase promoting complex subunit 5 [Podila epicladia]|nr:anaphase promoting complex subunit 5 [Podila epicladia]KAG0095004.1 anaphase promoting complex subunit 5 [Podila epicladia]